MTMLRIVFTLTFDSSPIKETFEKLSVSEFCSVLGTFQSVRRLEKRLESPAGRVFQVPQPRFGGCGTTPRRDQLRVMRNAAVPEAERPLDEGCKP